MRITIITVVLNSINTIERTINSILKQSYDDLEYIVIDGLSTDGTWDIIQKYKNQISYCASEKDDGIYDAMNKGIRQSSGDVIMFINAGDELLPDSAKIVIEEFENNDIDIFIGRVFYTNSNNIIGISVHNKELPWYGMPCCHQGVAARRELFSASESFSLKYKLCSDYDWFYNAKKNGYKFKWSRDILSKYDRDGLSSRNSALLVDESFDITKKYSEVNQETQIKKIFHNKIKKANDKFLIQTFLDNGTFELDNEVFQHDTYVIWGSGAEGYECFQILKKIGKIVEFFVDSNEEIINLIGKIEGISINLPDIRLIKKNIIVASVNYEDEIFNQAHEMTRECAIIEKYSELREKLILCIKEKCVDKKSSKEI